MPTIETSKRRSSRIRLDHFRALDRLAWIRLIGSGAAMVLTTAWLSGLGWDVREWSRRSERTHELASHGILSKAHAALETACDSCHVPFTPIDGTGWAARTIGSPRSSDGRCLSCHPGPDHQASARPGDVGSCASCHRDHRGRDVSLVAMPDQNCTRCHSATEEHIEPGVAPSFSTSITRFDADPSHHPEFALFRAGVPTDPGQLKFDHALHLSAGLTLEQGGRPAKTVGDLAASDRDEYRSPGGSDLDPVQLRCDSCHRLDVDQRLTAGSGTKSAGSYMRSIRYDRDCRACHPLTFDPELPAVRHGLQGTELSGSLYQSYAARDRTSKQESTVPERIDRPVPGRQVRPEVRETIEAKVSRAERILQGEKRCGECHSFEGKDHQIVPTRIPDLWFRHATFNHSSHRTANCRDCHSQAYPDSPSASRTSRDVMMPTIAVCQSCHVPKSSARGGATNGCTDCHRYHNGTASSLMDQAFHRSENQDVPPDHAPVGSKDDERLRWIVEGGKPRSWPIDPSATNLGESTGWRP